MDYSKKFLVCGGDLRHIKLAESLSQCGYDTAIYGFDEEENNIGDLVEYNDISEALYGRDIIILPLPCSLDDETLNMPMSKGKLHISDLLRHVGEKQIVVGGMVTEKLKKLAELYKIVVLDYFKREEMTVLNAIPTAEGAVQIAMENMPITIHGSNCLVMGFGRVGETLAKTLHCLGANVSVSARKFADFAWMKSYGYNGIQYGDLEENISKFDLIVNTIPTVLLNEKLLSKVSDNSLIIDLASKPGGVDFEKATELGKKVIWALSLPGNVAPVTAGIIIKDTIMNLLEELGV